MPLADDALLETLRATPPRRRPALLLDYLRDAAQEVMDPGLPELPSLRPEDRLFEHGVGSLVVVELKRRLEDALGTELPLTLFFAEASLGELVDHLVQLIEDIPAASTVAAPQPRQDVEAALLDAIDDAEKKYGA